MLLVAVVDVEGTHMSHDSNYDLFVCRAWLTRVPLWAIMVTSTYGILMIAFERYFAVIYPVWYNVSIKSKNISSVTFLGRGPSDSKFFFASGLLGIYISVLSKTEKLGVVMQLLSNLLNNL